MGECSKHRREDYEAQVCENKSQHKPTGTNSVPTGSADPLTEMIALGLGVPLDSFTNATKYGFVYIPRLAHVRFLQILSFHRSPHILGPTAADMNEFNKVNSVISGFHYDMNMLSVHGRARYPCLNVWERTSGKKVLVRIPKLGGPYLFVQAGKQLEHFTGGLIKAGYHEVIVTEAAQEV